MNSKKVTFLLKNNNQFNLTIKQLLILIAGLFSAFCGNPTLAQLTPDHTLGSENSIIRENAQIKGALADVIEGGAIRNSNLFHSFSGFNINELQRIYFANPSGIDNIFTRVTGANPSHIFGTLGVDGEANLLLINPHGFVFGKDAQLDITGSFTATTADSIIFNNFNFSAINPEAPPLLNISVPLGLQYGTNQNGLITNRGNLRVGENLTLAGQNLDLEGQISSGGDLTLFASENININAQLDTSGILVNNTYQSNGSDIKLVSQGNITINSGANITSQGLVGGNILIKSQGDLNVTNSNIASVNYGTEKGQGGSVQVFAQNVNLNYSLFGTITAGNVDAGNVDFKVHSLSASNIAGIGSISLPVPPELNRGDFNQLAVFIYTEANNGLPLEKIVLDTVGGNAGNIIINATDVKTFSGGIISAVTYSQGDAGNVVINAENVLFDGVGYDLTNTGVSSGSYQLEAQGNSGNIIINTTNLFVLNVAQITTGTFGKGDGGNIEIYAQKVVFDGSDYINDYQSGAFTSVQQGAEGNGGNIFLKTDILELLNGAVISANTLGNGNAGNILIEANSILLDNNSSIKTNVNPQAIGQGGAINLHTIDLTLTNNAQILAQSEGQGNAGNINIIALGELYARDSKIQAFANQGSGGTINITARDIRLWGNSDITTNVFNGAGGGGDIIFTANSILAFGDSDILAFARDGKGGNIIFNSPIFFGFAYHPAPFGTDPITLNGNNRVDINASGGINGLIILPDVSFIENSLTELPTNLIDPDALLANSCLVRTESGSKFMITGSGGLPQGQGDPSISHFATGEIQNITEENIVNNEYNWQKGDPIIEPTGVYRLASGELIMTHECSD